MSTQISKMKVVGCKRIKAVEVDIAENDLVVFGGKNRQGKTSMLDSVAWCLGGGKFAPSNPVNDESETLEITVILNDGTSARRGGKNAALTAVDSDGKKLNQSHLNDKVGAFSLNLQKFMDAPAKEKADVYACPIVKRRDEAAHGHYRTKDTILDIYDAMQRAITTGAPYQTRLDPASGPPCDTQGNFISLYQIDRDNWLPHVHPLHPDWDESLLSAWFDVCQKRWQYLEDDQIFPWDGREAFIYALIPYLVKERPSEKFEFYRDAALLASHSARCETLLLGDSVRAEYRQSMDRLDWLQFPDTHRIRPKDIREKLQDKKLIATDHKTGTTTLVDDHRLPPLPTELKPLLPLILKAADNLDRLQRREKLERLKSLVDNDD